MTEANPYRPTPFVQLIHPEWSKNASIYQINTRQFTPQGTFSAAEAQLPRLKDLGVDILWLMPVQEIGIKNRKGSLVSPYSVKDYYKVNPEFGIPQKLKHFIQAAHTLGLHVILDWVANHTAWDNLLVDQFLQHRSGQIFSFVRKNEMNQVFAVLNFSPQPLTVTFKESLCLGRYREYFSGETAKIADGTQLSLPPWEFRVYIR